LSWGNTAPFYAELCSAALKIFPTKGRESRNKQTFDFERKRELS
jgi:hypothetical protein